MDYFVIGLPLTEINISKEEIEHKELNTYDGCRRYKEHCYVGDHLSVNCDSEEVSLDDIYKMISEVKNKLGKEPKMYIYKEY